MKQSKRYLLVALALLLATVFCSAVAFAGEVAEEEGPDVTISFNWSYPGPVPFKYGNVGENRTFFVNISGTDRYLVNSVSFSSSDTSIIKVERDYNNPNYYNSYQYYGKYTVFGPSQKDKPVTISAYAYDDEYNLIKKADVVLDMQVLTASDMKFNDNVPTMITEGTSATLYSYLYFVPEVGQTDTSYTSFKDVIWSVDNTAVANITNGGILNAVTASETPITVTATLKQQPALTKTITIAIEKAKKPETITAIAFNSPNPYTIKKGTNLDLFNNYMTWQPETMTVNSNDFTWTTSDKNVVTVSSNGGVSAVAVGEATITASLKQNPAVMKSCIIKVVEVLKPATAIVPTQEKVTVFVGTNVIDLDDYINLDPADSDSTMVWSVDKTEFAKVKKDGKLTARKKGTVVATVVSKDSPELKKTITVEIKESAAEALSFSQKEMTVETSENPLDLIEFLNVKPASAASDLVWTTSDSEVASVSTVTRQEWREGYDPEEEEYYSYSVTVYAGQLTAKKPGGPVTITVSSKSNPDLKDTLTVTVTEKALANVGFDKTEYTIYKGQKLPLSEKTVKDPIDGRYKNITYSSSDPLTVGDDGFGYAVGDAVITVTARLNDDSLKTGTCTVHVKEFVVTGLAFSKPEYSVKLSKKTDLNLGTGSRLIVKPDDYSKILNAYEEDELLIWESSDTSIATVSSSGTVNALKPGEVTITVRSAKDTTGEIKASAKVTFEDEPITGLAFDKTEYTLKLYKSISINLSKNTHLKITPNNRSKLGLDGNELIWESSNEAVATVDQNGNVTAKTPGTTEITVKYAKNEEGVKATTTVKVEAVSGKKVNLSKSTLTLEPGLYVNQAFTATLEPATAYVKDVYYKVEDPELVDLSFSSSDDDYSNSNWFSVYSKGKAGTTKATIYIDDGTKVHSASVQITVKTKAPKLVLSTSNDEVVKTTKATIPVFKVKAYNKDSYRLYAMDENTGDEVYDVVWKSSNKKVATVDKHGCITPLKAGSTNITATTKDGNKVVATCKLTVKQYKITKITAPKTITLRVGANKYWLPGDLSIAPAGKVFNSELKFTNSNEAVISIDANGYVYANAAGKATVTVTAKDGSKKKATININVIEAVK